MNRRLSALPPHAFAQAPAKSDFGREVQPLLEERRITCEFCCCDEPAPMALRPAPSGLGVDAYFVSKRMR